MSQRAAKAKNRYRSDPEWRAKVLAANAARVAGNRKNLVYLELERTRKAVSKIRSSYEARLAHAERLFKKLERTIAKRDRLGARWKELKVDRNTD